MFEQLLLRNLFPVLNELRVSACSATWDFTGLALLKLATKR